MNQSVASVSSPVHHNKLPISSRENREKVDSDKSQHAGKSHKVHHEQHGIQKGKGLKQAVDQFPVQHKINDDRSLKAFDSLSKSLEKILNGATSVDASTADREMTEGGVRRIGKDLSRLFKGMGLDPHLAKQLSRNVTSSMQQEGVEQIDLSLTVTRSLNIEAYQVQNTYKENADGAGSVERSMSGLQVSAVQTRSFDFSLNLSTGEYSLDLSQSDSLSAAVFDYQARQALPADDADDDAVEQVPPETSDAPLTAQNEESEADIPVFSEAEGDGDISAFFMNHSSLIEISQQVRQAPVSQAFDTAADEEQETDIEDMDSPADAGLAQMENLYLQLDEAAEQPVPLFESLTRIRDLRIEQEQSVSFLRFSFDAFAPIGFAATNPEGYQTDLYPRPDGSLGIAEEKQVMVEA